MHLAQVDPAGCGGAPDAGTICSGYLSKVHTQIVCFDRGDQETLFFFVMNLAALRDAPPPKPEVVKVNRHITVSWTQGDKTYLLAGPEEPDFLGKYL